MKNFYTFYFLIFFVCSFAVNVFAGRSAILASAPVSSVHDFRHSIYGTEETNPPFPTAPLSILKAGFVFQLNLTNESSVLQSGTISAKGVGRGITYAGATLSVAQLKVGFCDLGPPIRAASSSVVTANSSFDSTVTFSLLPSIPGTLATSQTYYYHVSFELPAIALPGPNDDNRVMYLDASPQFTITTAQNFGAIIASLTIDTMLSTGSHPCTGAAPVSTYGAYLSELGTLAPLFFNSGRPF